MSSDSDPRETTGADETTDADAMTDYPAADDDTEAVEQVVEEVRDDIRHGQVDDDVTNVLEERFEEAGVQLRPEAIDDLAEDIENDVSS
ncbi:hypothetical protein [Microbacterium sp. USHLN186]|uniref:hypothetical protein n=1 Tax=Microbacterium sp. USHLN186 TaxID=3081286 RepID=UPI0030183311